MKELIEEFILVAYSKIADEKPPAFINVKNTCLNNLASIEFISLSELSKEIDALNKKISKAKSLIVFSHGPGDNTRTQNFFNEIKQHKSTLYIDYSGGDPSYHPFWADIQRSKNCNELYQCLKYWSKAFVINPLENIKHRTVNDLQPLSIELGRLIELIEKKDYNSLINYAKELSDMWGEQLNGPTNKIVRLWYRLVGKDGLCWGYSEVPKMPQYVSLPKKGIEEFCFYQWLKLFHGDERLDKWKALIDHCQLDIGICGHFIVKNRGGIYETAREIEKDIENIEGATPELLKEKLDKFIKWINQLNDLFEELVAECLIK